MSATHHKYHATKMAVVLALLMTVSGDFVRTGPAPPIFARLRHPPPRHPSYPPATVAPSPPTITTLSQLSPSRAPISPSPFFPPGSVPLNRGMWFKPVLPPSRPQLASPIPFSPSLPPPQNLLTPTRLYFSPASPPPHNPLQPPTSTLPVDPLLEALPRNCSRGCNRSTCFHCEAEQSGRCCLGCGAEMGCTSHNKLASAGTLPLQNSSLLFEASSQTSQPSPFPATGQSDKSVKNDSDAEPEGSGYAEPTGSRYAAHGSVSSTLSENPPQLTLRRMPPHSSHCTPPVN